MSEDLVADNNRFNYGTLEQAAASTARNIAERIRSRTREAALANGRDLIAIRRCLAKAKLNEARWT